MELTLQGLISLSEHGSLGRRFLASLLLCLVAFLASRRDHSCYTTARQCRALASGNNVRIQASFNWLPSFLAACSFLLVVDASKPLDLLGCCPWTARSSTSACSAWRIIWNLAFWSSLWLAQLAIRPAGLINLIVGVLSSSSSSSQSLNDEELPFLCNEHLSFDCLLSNPIMAENGTSSVPSKRKGSSQEDWENIKEDVFRIHILEDQTLKTTMIQIESMHGLRAKFVRLQYTERLLI